MSNIFEDVLTDMDSVEQELLGPDYKYYKQIKTPSEIGMSSDGNLAALGQDINGLVQYVELLVTGNSNASQTGGPLGNKFFLKTGAKCMDVETKTEQDRYIYINNVPEGNIPFISSGLGVDFSDFRGLIPGTMSDLNVLSPYPILQAFLDGSTPQCQKLTMETIDVNNNTSQETQYVTLTDIRNMDPCNFQNGQNPISGKKCQMAFTTMSQGRTQTLAPAPVAPRLPDDPIVQIYFGGLALLGIYILTKLIEK